MLDAYIIEKIRREQEERENSKRPVLRIEVPRPPDAPGRPTHSDEERGEAPDRGVFIIEL